MNTAPADTTTPPTIELPITMTGTSSAPPPPSPATFGRRGQVVVFGSSTLAASSTQYDASAGFAEFAHVSPDIDVFVARNVAIGLTLAFDYDDARGYAVDDSVIESRLLTVEAGPNVAVNVPLGGAFSLFPRVSAGIEWTHATVPMSGSGAVPEPLLAPPTHAAPYVSVEAALLLHAADHFFVGLAPSVFHDFASSSGGPGTAGQRTTLGAGFLVGGYWGGEAGTSDDLRAASPPVPPERRFGQAGEFVLTSDLALAIRSTQYGAPGESSLATTIAASLDYFVVDHLSIGAGATLASSDARGPLLDGALEDITSTVAFGPRVGVNVDLGTAFSLYPRASLSFGRQAFEAMGSSANQTTADLITAGLSVPLLVHPAQHVFLGFGPSVAHDVSRSVASPNDVVAPSTQNRSTTFAASFFVGGWL
ncbi:MAG TPA: hypothetical protein VHV30_05955 [Polyangiaceae bacterium]|nr:hypothetical protein [Polyangiaceae bacterium]